MLSKLRRIGVSLTNVLVDQQSMVGARPDSFPDVESLHRETRDVDGQSVGRSGRGVPVSSSVDSDVCFPCPFPPSPFNDVLPHLLSDLLFLDSR